MRPRDSRAAFRAVLDEEFGNSDGELSADEWLGGMKKFCEHMDDKAFEDEIAKLTAATDRAIVHTAMLTREISASQLSMDKLRTDEHDIYLPLASRASSRT